MLPLIIKVFRFLFQKITILTGIEKIIYQNIKIKNPQVFDSVI